MVWCGVVWEGVGKGWERGEGNSIELSGSVPYFVTKILLVCFDDDDVKCISFFF